MDRITIFVGHYGSGKTEVAVNYAIKLKEEGNDVIIVDLDIVNAYYRTKDNEKMLNEMGIEVISPTYANTNVDIPSLPAHLLKVFADKTKKVVFDVGGDDAGATALGRFFGYFSQEKYQMYSVINTKRPLTDNKENIIMMIRDININSRLEITGLINNTNLSYETSCEDILKGEEIVLSVAEEIKLPFIFTSLLEEKVSEYKKKTDSKLFPLKKYLKLPWQN
ncbi:MAG: MinD/ParA family protein [Ruminococcaceae bacterium]|nr:MinD/ParA family protein [Oscillospiraceae bacterium]